MFTVDLYVADVRRFLADRGNRDLRELTPADVSHAVLGQVGAWSPASVRRFGCALRLFLRYCFVTGLVEGDLSGAALPVSGRRRSLLPQGITPAQETALLRACDRRCSTGRRDYAVILLILRLGLRANEVATLRSTSGLPGVASTASVDTLAFTRQATRSPPSTAGSPSSRRVYREPTTVEGARRGKTASGAVRIHVDALAGDSSRRLSGEHDLVTLALAGESAEEVLLGHETADGAAKASSRSGPRARGMGVGASAPARRFTYAGRPGAVPRLLLPSTGPIIDLQRIGRSRAVRSCASALGITTEEDMQGKLVPWA